MKTVLIVAYYFPPLAASGAMRPLAFCRFLKSHGWIPQVLTTTPASVTPPHPVDPQLLTRLPSEIRIDAVAHGNPLCRLLDWRNRLRRAIPHDRSTASPPRVIPEAADMKRHGPAETLRDLKTFLLDWGFSFPDPQCAWVKPAIAHAKRRSWTDRPDIVLATGGPWSNLVVGHELANRWDVPLVVDYRDPWTSNPYVSFRSARLNAKARRLEQMIVRKASRVITNTEELRKRLQSDYPDLAGKVATITNGFDPDLFEEPNEELNGRDEKGWRAKTKGGLELCHFGTVYGKRTPLVLLQAVLELLQAGRITPADLSLRFIGAWEVDDPRCEEIAQTLEKAGLLRREPPVPHRVCLRRMREADALLVIQPDSPLQIPGKIYEYVATRRPLVLVGGEGATASLVIRHRLGQACPNRPADLQRMLAALVDGTLPLPSPCNEQIHRFDYKALTADLARVLDEVNQAHTRQSSRVSTGGT